MLQLLMLFFIIVGTYGGLTLLNVIRPRRHLSRSLRGRISLAVFFVFTGLSHFFMPEAFVQMLPATVPFRLEIIYATGLVQIVGAIGLLTPRLERLAAIGLILFLVGVLPANIYSAINYVEFGSHEAGPIYLLARIPFQLFLIGWASYFGLRTIARPKAMDLAPTELSLP
ncbi:MAG: DoxX family protein [Anaerolineae bacterium]|nr:DoxX family protein [Anaerolineae bacterium]